MNSRQIKRMPAPDDWKAARLRLHACIGSKAQNWKALTKANMEELKRQNEEQARPAAVAARRG